MKGAVSSGLWEGVCAVTEVSRVVDVEEKRWKGTGRSYSQKLKEEQLPRCNWLEIITVLATGP